MNYNGLSDREVLILVADRTERLDLSVNGDGDPDSGLVTRVAKVEQELEDMHVPGRTERWGMIGTVAVAAVGIAAKVLGIPLPV